MVLQNLIDNPNKRFILVGGKGGTGKTSSAASIAVYFAERGEKTLIISTDPAHSLSDSFDQPLGNKDPTKIIGVNGELYGLEIDPEQASGDFAEVLSMSGASTDDLANSLGSMGLDEFKDMFSTMPPGVDEALALAKVIQFIESPEYQYFQRIIFDTAPTGHTLRLLALPDFLDSFLGKAMKLRAKINNMFAGFKSLLGMEAQRDNTVEAIEALKETIVKVRAFFQDEKRTEFIIVTIPTIMAINESERLAEELKLQNIAVKNVIVNQIMPQNINCKFCQARSAGQEQNLEYIRNLFINYHLTEVPFFDREIRGVPALRIMAQALFEKKFVTSET